MNILLDSDVFNAEHTGVAKSTLLLLKACKSKKEIEIDCFNLKHENKIEIAKDNLNVELKSNYFFINNYNFNKSINRKQYNFAYFPSNQICKIYKKYLPTTGLMIHDVLPLQIPNYFNSIFSEKNV